MLYLEIGAAPHNAGRALTAHITMNTTLKKRLTMLLPAFLAAALFACGRGDDKSGIIVAKVDGHNITLKAFEDAFARIIPPDGPSADDNMRAVKRDLLSQMIIETLILDEAERMGVTITNDELEAAIDALKKDYGEPAFRDAITERYGDITVWREEIRRKLIIKKTVAKVTSDVKAPAEQTARKYYDEHIKEFDVAEQVRARMIVTGSEDDARKIRAALTPENFAKTAKEASLSPEAKNGGDLGFFGRGDMPKEFEDAVFGLKPGEISPVVKTAYGYHIFYVEEHRKGGRLQWNDVRSKIIERLRAEGADAEFGKWLAGLKTRSHIEVYDALL